MNLSTKIKLKHEEGLTDAEIATELDISLSEVKKAFNISDIAHDLLF